MNKDSFFGRQREIDQIEKILTDPRESSMINIIGGFGMGKSALVSHLEWQITNEEIKFSESHNPIVIPIQGRSFSDSDRFLDFLFKNISSKLFNVFPDKKGILDLEDLLLEITLLDYPIVILIDNFSRILERIKIGEAQDLNRLRPAGIYYVLVTDHRAIEEIAPKLYKISDFFKAARPINLRPLSPPESMRLLSDTNEKSEGETRVKIKNDHLKLIADIAGGTPATLLSVYDSFINENISFDQSSGHLFERVVHFLPVEPMIEYYLSKILSIVHQLSLQERKLLVDICINQNDDLLDATLQRKFENMGLVLEKSSEINGKLIQHKILTEVIPSQFSGPEEIILDVLLVARPGTVAIEKIYKALQGGEGEITGDDKTKRKQLDSTIARLRKKLNSIPNAAAFSLANARGNGYFFEPMIPFDQYISEGSSLF